ncbi:ankyrin repeat-containing domain protein [Fusarium flagelliforme]|uniref:Ankyrin repeat domain-containing protein n=1 Tax=Fusarium flagelliforme TaxID=2675880 RepID=A0A395MXG3_9HYPO|nr:ankyrin repeat-containing domain protein [Fusarium flagelliforme]KAH7173727.1 ankyrin repeat-containing domain protein [Fusarium flagelliforme]RFN52584.1 ankyrin repeat domain-containing protein [Fusarium flagelliforme]
MKPEDYKQFLRSHKFDPENRLKDRGHAIHAAIIEKRVYIAIELLNLYPKDCLEVRSRTGSKNWRTPLHNASENERTVVVKSLLDKGADVNARSFRKLTPLIFATEARNLEIVKLLVEKGADVNLQTDQKTSERSALHVAANIESPDFILTLLVNGADPKLVNTTGNTPLHLAVRSGCASAAALLLFHGASPTVKNENGKSPFDLVENLNQGDREQFTHIFECAKKEGEFGDFLDRHIRPGIPVDLVAAIHWATSQDLERAVAYLLHIDPHAAEATLPRGWYPLHVAARAGHEKCVSVLLEHGAEVDSKTKTGYTPLMLAAEKGHEKTFHVLLEHGASRSATNESGENAWRIARQRGHSFPMLLSVRHVNPSEVNRDGQELQDNNSLAPPKERPQRRTPSPGPRDVAEDPGELYAIGDARSEDEQSTPAPQNSDNFEAFLKTLEETWYNRIGWHPDDDIERPTDKWPGPVKIAILDTGIDLSHPDFSQRAKRRTKIGAKQQRSGHPEEIQSKRIKACKNFADGPEDDVTDEDGHGTHIAGLIMAIAPRAELYIAKVSSSQKPDTKEGNPKKAPKRDGRKAHPIREALRWAIENRVNIINMSLGFKEQGSLELVQTLTEADKQGICVFAAAANHGDIHAVAWPARDRLLANCVGSTDEQYKLAWFSPTANARFPIFGTFGVNISSHWPGGGYRRMSGTSVSTPIAVGMAAMIIAFLNKKNDWDVEKKEQNLDKTKEWRIRGTMGMGRVLTRMCRDSNGLRLLSPKLMWEDDSRRNSDPIAILGLLSSWEGYEVS